MAADYRDVVIESLGEEIAELKQVIESLVVWRTMCQEALAQLHTANLQRAKLTIRLQEYMKIANDQARQLEAPPPKRPLSDFPTDTAPAVSVHAIRWD